MLPGTADPPEARDTRFANTALAALRSTQAHLADVPAEHFVRYRPDVTPFVCLTGDAAAALAELAARMQPGELEWVLHRAPEPLLDADAAARIVRETAIEIGLPIGVGQMVFPADAPLPEAPDAALNAEIVPLDTPGAAREMVDLTLAAFPGFFRLGTPAMGPYFGIRRGGRLIAMGGDRLCFDEFREVSGICTLPEFRSQGLASAIVCRILREHRAAGFRSYLHFGSTNASARRLYAQLGFQWTREVFATRVFKPQP